MGKKFIKWQQGWKQQEDIKDVQTCSIVFMVVNTCLMMYNRRVKMVNF